MAHFTSQLAHSRQSMAQTLTQALLTGLVLLFWLFFYTCIESSVPCLNTVILYIFIAALSRVNSSFFLPALLYTLVFIVDATSYALPGIFTAFFICYFNLVQPFLYDALKNTWHEILFLLIYALCSHALVLLIFEIYLVFYQYGMLWHTIQ